jgi:hypothetical protein
MSVAYSIICPSPISSATCCSVRDNTNAATPGNPYDVGFDSSDVASRVQIINGQWLGTGARRYRSRVLISPLDSAFRFARPRLPETEKIKNQREQSDQCKQDFSVKVYLMVSASFFSLPDCGEKHVRCRLNAICQRWQYSPDDADLLNGILLISEADANSEF